VIESGSGPFSFLPEDVKRLAMEIADVKRRLRDEIRGRILSMPPDVRKREEASLVDRLNDLPGFHEAETVLLYASVFPEEFDTRPMLCLALDSNKRLICPRVRRKETRLALYEIRDLSADFVRGTLGIPEPRSDRSEVDVAEVDWVLVPGLGFDERCYRIGRGAGYYDRLLPWLRDGVPRWSLCLSTQWVSALPVEPHDQQLDGVADAERILNRP
jgi:5-formyltetrahydrofolate cyclo-ligase